jgi:hypothetical protein
MRWSLPHDIKWAFPVLIGDGALEYSFHSVVNVSNAKCSPLVDMTCDSLFHSIAAAIAILSDGWYRSFNGWSGRNVHPFQLLANFDDNDDNDDKGLRAEGSIPFNKYDAILSIGNMEICDVLSAPRWMNVKLPLIIVIAIHQHNKLVELICN